MLPLRRQHHDTPSTASQGPRRGGALALATALMLALSACSPGQESDPAVDEETAPAAVESDASTPETEESAETDADQDSQGGGDGAATPTPDAADTTDEQNAEVAPPASFEIPAIEAGSELLHLGLRDNDTLEVPPGDPDSPASWYTGSPAPGEPGPSVLLGHVDDSAGDPGVFYDLPDLVEGDEITVDQEDGDTATFVVTKAEQYGKNTFPTLEVYGNTEDPELRLITCDGYNEATGEYEDNYVVYATLAS
ncbi:class F sortase [Nesterenkonia halotolerans]|uniref:class F sortase n=1 Tax=Nesterenkonia halotolerans TaxID=225325 RepID=UPI003EE792DB